MQVALTGCLQSKIGIFFVVFQFLSHGESDFMDWSAPGFVTSWIEVRQASWIEVRQASLTFTISQSLFKRMSVESVIQSNHLILCYPFLQLPSIFPSIRVFSYGSALGIRGPKNWSFSFSISPSNEYSGLISFRMDWLYLLALQMTLKSLLQHHGSKS